MKKYFSWAATWTVLIAIILGTNLYYYTIYAGAMSHVYSFALICAILFAVDKYYERPAFWLAILFAFLLGWLTLVRPTNISVLIFVVLFIG